MNEELLARVPLLVYANKQDLDLAMDPDDVSNTKKITIYVFVCRENRSRPPSSLTTLQRDSGASRHALPWAKEMITAFPLVSHGSLRPWTPKIKPLPPSEHFKLLIDLTVLDYWLFCRVPEGKGKNAMRCTYHLAFYSVERVYELYIVYLTFTCKSKAH